MGATLSAAPAFSYTWSRVLVRAGHVDALAPDPPPRRP
jgi:hypothetical protein